MSKVIRSSTDLPNKTLNNQLLQKIMKGFCCLLSLILHHSTQPVHDTKHGVHVIPGNKIKKVSHLKTLYSGAAMHVPGNLTWLVADKRKIGSWQKDLSDDTLILLSVISSDSGSFVEDAFGLCNLDLSNYKTSLLWKLYRV